MTDIAGERRLLTAQGLDIEAREDWGARQDYRSARRVDTPARGFFLHIAVIACPARTVAAERAAMRTIEAIGQDRFGIGCSYNASSCQSGRLYELQPLTRRGAHTVNDKGIARYGRKGASLNYAYRALVLPQNVGDEVTDAQIDDAARWAAAQIRAGLAVRGARWDLHRTVAWKDCPGDHGAHRLGDLNCLTAHYEASGLGRPVTPTPEEDDDMKPHAIKLAKTNPQRYAYVLDDMVIDTDHKGDPLVAGAASIGAFEAVYETDQALALQVDIVQQAIRRHRGD